VVAKRKNLFIAPTGSGTPGRPARSLVTTLSELPRFQCKKSNNTIWKYPRPWRSKRINRHAGS